MAFPRITFTDDTGAATLSAVVPTLSNWVPDVDEIGAAEVSLGTGLTTLFSHRTDYTVSFDLEHLPADVLDVAIRLKRWLLRGGTCTVYTEDAEANVYSCVIRPGTTPSIAMSDRQNLEYTLHLDLVNVGP